MVLNWRAPLRHLILLVVTALLSWAGTELIPFIEGQPGYGVLLSMLLTAVLAYFTPLVNSYGVGATRQTTEPVR